MSRRILWLDNDPAYLDPYVSALAEEGYQVDVVSTVTRAEELLHQRPYVLLILDVMIPTKNSEEELRYQPSQTESGHKTGLRFYIQNGASLSDNKLPVLVLTVRLDKNIRDEFIAAGLPRDCFATKYDLRDISVFLKKITSLCGGGRGAAVPEQRANS